MPVATKLNDLIGELLVHRIHMRPVTKSLKTLNFVHLLLPSATIMFYVTSN